MRGVFGHASRGDFFLLRADSMWMLSMLQQQEFKHKRSAALSANNRSAGQHHPCVQPMRNEGVLTLTKRQARQALGVHQAGRAYACAVLRPECS